jgi:GMP synthase (glutamine-hydrolysing)
LPTTLQNTDSPQLGKASAPARRVPSVLLLQIRDRSDVELQERECFRRLAEAAGGARLRFHNLLSDPEPGAVAAADCEALVVGGAGAHSVTESYAFTDPLRRFVERWVDDGRPLLGSCFGHQFIAAALGGRVATDPEREEIGTFDVELTEAGAADPIFAGLPRRFPVQLGHHDRVVELPPGGVELAASERCPAQAFRLAGLPVWGFQFHVEMDERALLERAAVYRDSYAGGEDGLGRLAARLRPTPEAASLFGRFLALVAGARGEAR